MFENKRSQFLSVNVIIFFQRVYHIVSYQPIIQCFAGIINYEGGRFRIVAKLGNDCNGGAEDFSAAGCGIFDG